MAEQFMGAGGPMGGGAPGAAPMDLGAMMQEWVKLMRLQIAALVYARSLRFMMLVFNYL